MEQTIYNNPEIIQLMIKACSGFHFKGLSDMDCTIVDASTDCLKITGYAPEELIGSKAISYANLVYPADLEQLRSSRSFNQHHGHPYTLEYRIICKQGRVKWVREFAAPLPVVAEEAIQMEGFIQDITPYKTTAAMSNAFTSYQNAVNSASIVSIADKSGKIIFVNELFCQVSQYSRQELIGKDHRIVNSGYHPKSFFAGIWKEILSGNIWRGQIRNRAKDGSYYWVDTVISPVMNDHGVFDQFLSIRNVITEQKENEYALIESEALNRSVLASLNANIAIVDESGVIVKVNSNWENFSMANGEPDLLKTSVGSNYFDVIEKAGRAGDALALNIMEGIRSVFQNRVPVFEIEYPCHSADEERWFQVQISKFENDAKRLVFCHFDITKRKLYDESIRKSEALLREAQKLAKIGSWELDIASKRLIWSDENYRIFEVDKDHTELTYQSFLELVHPEDREYVNNVYKESLEKRIPYNIVHRLLFKDDRVKYVNEQCETFYDSEGRPVRSIGTTQDISEIKLSEILLENQRILYKNVVDNISDGLIIDDVKGRVVFANKKFLSMIGICEADLGNFNFDDFVAPEYKGVIRQRHIQRMKGEDVSSNFEYIGLRKDGSRRWFEAHVSKVVRGNKVIGTQSLIRDITEAKDNIDILKASEIEKTKLLKELNMRYNELMQFNYIISHNLRAPVANIIGLADMFRKEGIAQAEQDKIVKYLQDSVLKIDNLINDLSMILASRSDINSKMELINFEEIVNRVKGILSNQIKETDTRIVLNIGKDAESIYSIRSFVKSILYNLVSNAIKYRSAEKPPHIHIAVSKTGTQYQIIVKDNGIGIDMERHGKDIFRLYKRFHPSYEGRGIGLNMTKTQIETLGGSIAIESCPGEGTIFTILLPVIQTNLMSLN